MRILLLVAIGLMLYIVLKPLWKKVGPSGIRRGFRKRESTGLVKCQYCGIHVVQVEAYQSEGKGGYYCCAEHQALGKDKYG